MVKLFYLTFGSGDSRNFTGLSPTFVIFSSQGGTALAAPAISEVASGSGFYGFTYSVSSTFSIIFQADGGAAVTDQSLRFVKGSLDPVAAVDQSLGYAVDSYGTTVGASTVFGMVNRINELWQADSTFSKTTGTWSNYAKGTSTLLYQKTLSNSSAQVTKV